MYVSNVIYHMFLEFVVHSVKLMYNKIQVILWWSHFMSYVLCLFILNWLIDSLELCMNTDSYTIKGNSC